MRLLHLSDIHFREPDCLNPMQDPDRPFRSLLERDVRTLCQDGLAVDVIVVSGDIAFKGHAKEFETAEAWLVALARSSGCSIENILVVPGNHDVDRGICARVVSVSNAQNAIASAPAGSREAVLRRQLQDADAGKALFAPLAAYNHFAAKFGCNVFAPEQPFWHKNFQIASGVKLRIFGLTSTLISGLADRDAGPGRLYLSPLQTVLDYEDNVLNAVVAHHPPSWYSDAQAVEDAVNSRAAVQMFGHEHRQRCMRDTDFIRFAAGAVNPERGEPDWKPGYNLIDILVNGEGKQRRVVLNSRIRHFQGAPERFSPVLTKEGEDVWIHSLKFPAEDVPSNTVADPSTVSISPATSSNATSPVCARPTVVVSEGIVTGKTHNLVYRFWNLSVSQKRDIALKLGLITTDDLRMAEPERYARAMKVAAERGLVEKLAQEVQSKEEERNGNGR